jgi:endonuclease YncB( thermonuclease family)
MRRPDLRLAAALIAVVVTAAGGAAWWQDIRGQDEPVRQDPAPISHRGEGLLVRVVDGDTVVVRYHDFPMPLRIRSIDTAESVAPEPGRNTRLGADTSAWAKGYLTDQRIRVDFERRGWGIATDRYGRALGDLWIDRGPPGPDPSDELYAVTVVAAGLSRYITAWGRHPTQDSALRRAEDDARSQGLGVWKRSR